MVKLNAAYLAVNVDTRSKLPVTLENAGISGMELDGVTHLILPVPQRRWDERSGYVQKRLISSIRFARNKLALFSGRSLAPHTFLTLSRDSSVSIEIDTYYQEIFIDLIERSKQPTIPLFSIIPFRSIWNVTSEADHGRISTG